LTPEIVDDPAEAVDYEEVPLEPAEDTDVRHDQETVEWM
jgi:hypothetical protein